MGDTEFSKLSDDQDLWGDEPAEAPASERPLPPHLEAPEGPPAGGEAPPERAEAPERGCANHPETRANARCATCERWLCGRCRVLSAGQVLCRSCPAPATAYRPPRLLRATVAASGALLALSLLHRALARLRPEPVEPLLGWADAPAWLRELTWGDVSALDAVLQTWSGAAALVLGALALCFARGGEGQTWRVAWRVLLAVLFCGAAVLLYRDAVVAALF